MADDFDPFGLRETGPSAGVFAPPPLQVNHFHGFSRDEHHRQRPQLHMVTAAGPAEPFLQFDVAPSREPQQQSHHSREQSQRSSSLTRHRSPHASTPVTTTTTPADESSLFDPFGLSVRSDSQASAMSARRVSISPPPEVSRIHRKAKGSASSQASASVGTTVAASAAAVSAASSSSMALLPPKLVVRLSVHEEVASVVVIQRDDGDEGTASEGAAEVSVEGTVLAQVQSSDATKNAPFTLVAAGAGDNVTFAPDPRRSRPLPPPAAGGSSRLPGMLVSVPKEEIGFVPVGRYRITERVPHTPLLLERKVTFHKTTVRIAVQVRSRLTNAGDLEDLTVAVAVPEHVDGRTVRVVRGDGTWDDLKRIVKWRLKALQRGESYMVSATARLWHEPKAPEDRGGREEAESGGDPFAHIRFPVLLRCTAPSDKVSTVELKAVPADGHPASFTVTQTSSFRMLHRLI